MKEELGFFHIIEPEGKPQTQYGDPEFCQHCGCKLNRYNRYDACYCCQEKGKRGFRREIIQLSKSTKIEKNILTLKRLLEMLRKKEKQEFQEA